MTGNTPTSGYGYLKQSCSIFTMNNRPSWMLHGSSTLYDTVYEDTLCGANCYVLQCPQPKDFNFEPYDLTKLTASESAALANIPEYRNDFAALQAELQFGTQKEQSKASRVNIFMGGRIALRRAIYAAKESGSTAAIGSNSSCDKDKQQFSVGPILTNTLGAPCIPTGVTGSISHKEQLAVAAALEIDPSNGGGGYIGVDIEKCSNKASEKLKQRLFTPDEQTSIDGLAGTVTKEEEVMLMFSFKEAIYKALNPYLTRYVEFTEAEVYPLMDGTARIIFKVKTGEKFGYKAEYRRVQEKYWLTCVHCWKL